MVPPNDPKKTGPRQTQPVKKTVTGKPPTPPSPVPPKKPQSPLVPVLLVIGLLMLGAVGWLTYNSMSTTRALEQKVAELEEAEKLRGELENQYNEAIAELDALKSDNDQINALIDQQKAELESQRNEINRLLRDKRQLDAARAELREIKANVEAYVAEIEQLKAEQEMLAQENLLLQGERDSLSATLEMKVGENQELSEARAQLVSERDELSRSVELGSVVKVKDVKVTGQKLRKGGKAADRNNAKKVDQLKVCFTTIVNDLVQPGTEEFFIRIISPKGETLAIDDLGSGAIVNNKTGEEVRYTQVKEYDYANDETQLCFLWNPNMPFQSGKYDVEIYNKGHLSGVGTFELK